MNGVRRNRPDLLALRSVFRPACPAHAGDLAITGSAPVRNRGRLRLVAQFSTVKRRIQHSQLDGE
jgi:hypothetical protein